MWVSYGNGGWVRVDDGRLPGPMFMRLRRDDAARWSLAEWYVDGRDQRLSADVLAAVAKDLDELVAAIADEAHKLDSRYELPGPDISTLATYFQWSPRSEARHWADQSFQSRYPSAGVARAPRARERSHQDLELPQIEPPSATGRPMKDPDFLATVATAYRRAVARGDRRPAFALMECAGGCVDIRTVHKWIETARREGYLDTLGRGRTGG